MFTYKKLNQTGRRLKNAKNYFACYAALCFLTTSAYQDISNMKAVSAETARTLFNARSCARLHSWYPHCSLVHLIPCARLVSKLNKLHTHEF